LSQESPGFSHGECQAGNCTDYHNGFSAEKQEETRTRGKAAEKTESRSMLLTEQEKCGKINI